MSEFKVGDEVICIAGYEYGGGPETGSPETGGYYTVAKLEPSDGFVRLDGIDGDWGAWRFRMGSPAPKEVPSTYETLGAEIGRLVQEKQAAYGSSFQKAGDIMRILYPEGISPEKMDDALTIVRMLDKMFRIASDKDAFGESPYRDLAGYSLLGAKRSAK